MNETNLHTFFELLRAGLFLVHGGRVVSNDSFSKDVDWQKVYHLAQEQSVLGLVLQGIEEQRNHNHNLNIPQMLLLQWIGEVQMIEQQNKEMNAFVADLIEKLRKYNIYTLLIKGQGVAQAYERPLWRSSGDVDLFLSDDNYEKAKKILIPNASSVETESLRVLHLGMTIDGWAVELHGKLNGNLSQSVENLLDEIKRDTFNRGQVRSWVNGKTQVLLMKEENEILYGFIHFLNHFYKDGVGLRQICDWCRLLYTYMDSLNYGLFESRIKRAGLMTEWKAFGAFSVKYLGMPVESMPFYSTDPKWNHKADKICSFIMSVGNMGHNRNISHFSKYPYLFRKCVSMGRRVGDLTNHAMIFPLDSIRFFPRIMFNGIKSAIRGE